MIQAIKRWLQEIFARWPWQSKPETNYAHAVATLNKSAAQEPPLRTTVDGSISQPGITSIAVEHTEDDVLDAQWSMLDERPERTTRPPTVEDVKDSSCTASIMPTQQAKNKDTANTGEAPTTAQKLVFLKYLVQRGLVNEGFAEGQEPEQYKNK